MRRPRAWLIAAVLLAVSATPSAQQQAPTMFRTGVDAVMIDVSVFTGNMAVANLTAADFIVTDNGVAQTVTTAGVEALPVDLTLVLDASGSMTSVIDRVQRDVRTIAQGLRPDDGLRVITFATLVSSQGLIRASQVGGVNLPETGGSTSFYSALFSALVVARRTGTADRRQLVVAMSDTDDSTSLLGPKDVQNAAATSDAVLHLFKVSAPYGSIPAAGWHPYWMSSDPAALTALAEQTGGQAYFGQVATDIPGKVAQVLAAFRTSYVLRYTATGVKPEGWHDVVIRVNKPGKFTVRAKKGYVGVSR